MNIRLEDYQTPEDFYNFVFAGHIEQIQLAVPGVLEIDILKCLLAANPAPPTNVLQNQNARAHYDALLRWLKGNPMTSPTLVTYLNLQHESGIRPAAPLQLSQWMQMRLEQGIREIELRGSAPTEQNRVEAKVSGLMQRIQFRTNNNDQIIGVWQVVPEVFHDLSRAEAYQLMKLIAARAKTAGQADAVLVEMLELFKNLSAEQLLEFGSQYYSVRSAIFANQFSDAPKFARLDLQQMQMLLMVSDPEQDPLFMRNPETTRLLTHIAIAFAQYPEAMDIKTWKRILRDDVVATQFVKENSAAVLAALPNAVIQHVLIKLDVLHKATLDQADITKLLSSPALREKMGEETAQILTAYALSKEFVVPTGLVAALDFDLEASVRDRMQAAGARAAAVYLYANPRGYAVPQIVMAPPSGPVASAPAMPSSTSVKSPAQQTSPATQTYPGTFFAAPVAASPVRAHPVAARPVAPAYPGLDFMAGGMPWQQPNQGASSSRTPAPATDGGLVHNPFYPGFGGF